MQRWALIVLIITMPGLVACSGQASTGASELPAAQITPTEPAPAMADPTESSSPSAASPTVAPTSSPTVLLEPSPTAPPPPTQGPAPTAGPTHVPSADLSLDAADIVLYPVPYIYAGDKVTFQLLPHVPESLTPSDISASILVDGVLVASGPLDRRNWNGQAEAVYEWAWDTTGLTGDHQIEITLDPDDVIQNGDEDPNNNRVALTANVTLPTGQAAREVAATWNTTEVACCFVHVVSNTAAERDLPTLLPMLEAAVQQAASRLTAQPSQKLHVYFIDRVVGQGGFAGTDIVVSYVDRRYAGGGIYELLVHEATHILDQQFAPQRVTFLAEGLAVWTSGGHYKAENIPQRMTALFALGKYIPLSQLIDNFYPVQHEIGYLEAAGFVNYLIERSGWGTFKNFYSDVSADDGPTLAASVDVNLQRYYGSTLAQIEQEWLAAVQGAAPDANEVEDLRTTIRYYDVTRRYQETYDPTAHYLNAWLPHPTQVREFGNPADLTRRPETEMNVTLELMLVSADQALRAGDYSRANVILDSLSNIIDNGGTIIDPMATNYLRIVRAAMEFDYKLQQVDLMGANARALATQAPNNRLTTLVMELRGQNWVILSH